MEMYKVAHGLASKATSVQFLQNNNMQTRPQSRPKYTLVETELDI